MKRLFGTNGIRWQPDKIEDENFTLKLGLSVGQYFGKGKSVCIGMDSRMTSPMISTAISSGIMSAGCDIVDLGMVPTPTLQYGVMVLKQDGGVVITASHNPPEFNGVKCIASDGTELARSEEEKIENFYFQESQSYADWQAVGRRFSNHSIRERHISHILSQFESASKQIQK